MNAAENIRKDILSAYDITQVQIRRNENGMLEEDFQYNSPSGRPFRFTLCHDETATGLAKAFSEYIFEVLDCNIADPYERDVMLQINDAALAVKAASQGRRFRLPKIVSKGRTLSCTTTTQKKEHIS